jgi:hypothetical protein
MECEISSLYSSDFSNCLYTKSDESSQHPCILFRICFNIILPSKRRTSELYLQVFNQNPATISLLPAWQNIIDSYISYSISPSLSVLCFNYFSFLINILTSFS